MDNFKNFQFGKYKKISNLENSKSCQFGKFEKFNFKWNLRNRIVENGPMCKMNCCLSTLNKNYERLVRLKKKKENGKWV